MSTELTFFRGDSWPFTVDSITDFTGASVTNVAAWECNWTMRKIGGGDLVARASTTTAEGVTTISRGEGLFSWTVPPSITSGIAPDFYAFDTELTDASGNKQTSTGIIRVSEDQTH